MSLDPAELAVLAANEAFYESFTRGDLEAMDAVWAEDGVTCVHPGWDLLVGRQQVMASWTAILAGDTTGTIRCTNPVARVHADGAVVICYEELEGATMIATNTFVYDGVRWRMTHHHASQIARRVQFTTPSREDLN
jgi:ketosteroid isomerase-like protein